MFDTKKIDEITHRLLDALPPGVKSSKRTMEKNFRVGLTERFYQNGPGHARRV